MMIIAALFVSRRLIDFFIIGILSKKIEFFLIYLYIYSSLLFRLSFSRWFDERRRLFEIRIEYLGAQNVMDIMASHRRNP